MLLSKRYLLHRASARGTTVREMRLSVIIPTLNEEARIGSTIQSLRRLSEELELIVADGGSTDLTVSQALGAGVLVVEAERGRGQQLQAGAAQASGEVLWFVHADTVPPAGALSAIEAALADAGVAGGNFGLIFDGPSRAARQLTIIYPWLRILRLYYGDSGIFVRREVYQQIGGFRRIALFEDLDLAARMRRAGRFVHLPCNLTTSSRRFEQRSFALMWVRWTTLQVLYWCGVSPNRLARWYRR